MFVAVAVAVGVGDGPSVAVAVMVGVADGDGLAVGVFVAVAVRVAVGVAVGVMVGVMVRVTVPLAVGLAVGVGVAGKEHGDWATADNPAAEPSQYSHEPRRARLVTPTASAGLLGRARAWVGVPNTVKRTAPPAVSSHTPPLSGQAGGLKATW